MPPNTTVVIDYDTWMRDTASFGRARSAELKAVDAAFMARLKLGTGDSLTALTNALNTWKATHGPGDGWKKSSRNSKRAVDRLIALVEGKGDSDDAFSNGMTPDFMHPELINARLGVLYLFGRLNVSPNIFKMVLEGGLDIAGQSLDIGGASDTVKDNFEDGSKVGMKVGGYIGGKIEHKIMNKVMPGAPIPQGVIGSQRAGTQATTVYAEKVLRDAEATQALANRTGVQKIREKVQQWLEAVVEKIKDTLKEKFGTLEGIAGMIKTLVNGCVTMFAAKAAPFVGGGLELASACGKTLDAAVTRFRTWKAGKDVEVSDGHPGVIVQSITRAMTMSLFEGMWAMLKGAGTIAMDAVGFGAGALVNLLVSITELLIKFIWRLVEVTRIAKFCNQAVTYWGNRASPDSIHLKPFAFTEWYRSAALNIPTISILTLNTGICGDKMRYLSMYKANGNGSNITSQEFLAGARFLDNLKPWGAKYLSDTGYSFHGNGDILVDELVGSFATSHEKEKTTFDKIISVVTS